MKKENGYRRDVVKMLKPLRAFPVENVLGVGMPDICCLAGWIEMKRGWWPATADLAPEICIRDEQKIWHKNWRTGGGRSFILTVMMNGNRHWLLHDGNMASKLGFVNCGETIASAIYQGPKPDTQTLIHLLLTHKEKS